MELEAKAPSAINLRMRLTAVLLGAAAVLLALAPHASAVYYHHPFVSMFGPDGTADTKFGFEMMGIAVDEASHDVYLLERKQGVGNSLLYRFTATGQPHNFTAGPSAGANTITGLTVEPIGSLIGLYEVAVAPPGAAGGTAGDIYVNSGGAVEIYSPTGAHLGTLDGSGSPNPLDPNSGARGLTTDAAGNLYVAYSGDSPGRVDKYVPTGNPVSNSDFDSETSISGCCPAVRGGTVFGKSGEGGQTVDFSNGDLYVGENVPLPLDSGVGQYDEAGTKVSFIETAEAVVDVAVDSASGSVFVASATSISAGTSAKNRKISIYGKGVLVAPPTASIDPPSAVTYKSAHFSGTVNSGGTGEAEATTYRFQCAPACSGLEGSRGVPTDAADHVVSDDAEELTPETTYTVKLIATNGDGGGQRVEDEASFETPAKPLINAPVATIDPVSEVTAESAHLSGTVDPMGTGPGQGTTYRFEYSTDGVKWIASKEQGPIEGTGPQAVSDDLGGLEPNTSYSVRLKAVNDGGEDVSDEPNPSFSTEAVAPLAEATAATQVLSDSAQINARVNPRNSQTTYYFQWGKGDCASNPCASIPASEDGDAGADGEFIWVSAQIKGLTPSTTYTYRLVAESPAGKATTPSVSFTTEASEGACPNEALRVGASASLPDCRAYELVSPLEKTGGNVSTYSQRTRVATDGDAVSYTSYAAFAGATGSPYSGNEYLSIRGSDGWDTKSISPSQPAPYDVVRGAFTGFYYTGGFSPDLDTGVFRALSPIPGETSANVEGVANLYRATGLRSGNPDFQLLSDSETPLPGSYKDIVEMKTIAMADASADFDKVVFETQNNLTSDASGDGYKVYESEGGEVRLARILPDSACPSPSCPAAQSAAGQGTTAAGSAAGVLDSGAYTNLSHAVSDDGSKVFFTAGDPLKMLSGVPAYWGSLYARIDGTSTVQIDASERKTLDPAGPGRSRFGMATPDGETVYFTSAERLLDADTDGSGLSLYRYDFDKPEGQRLGLIPTPGFGPDFVAGISDSGDIVYVGAHGGGGGSSLFVIHEGEASPAAGGLSGTEELGESSYLMETPLRVTPDGRYAMFVSEGNLVGYDPKASGCEQVQWLYNEIYPCRNIYLYSYDSGELNCLSCDFGHTSLGAGIKFPQSEVGIPLEPTLLNTSAPLSSDGRYVFFSTAATLDPHDTNGRVDAYAYDSEKQEALLISSGQCNCDSAFQNASPDGHDVFFTTREQLVRSDSDDLVDIYDARINGGIAAQNAIPAAECQGDACQPTPDPGMPRTPASNGFEGPGSASERKPPTRGRCAKGKRRAKGAGKSRCVPKKKHSRKRANANRGGGR